MLVLRMSIFVFLLGVFSFCNAMEEDAATLLVGGASCRSDLVEDSSSSLKSFFFEVLPENEISFEDDDKENLDELLTESIEKPQVHLELQPLQTMEGCFSFVEKFYALMQKQLFQQGLVPSDIVSLQSCYKDELIRFEDKVLCSAIVLPDDAQIDVLGDLHGDIGPIHALLEQLVDEGVFNAETFSLTASNRFIIFLGDLIDRGPGSLAVLFYVKKLVEANPGKIFLVRGNHEKFFDHRCGLKKEIAGLLSDKKGRSRQAFAQDILSYFYNKLFVLLPQILFVSQGSRRFAFVHGGIDHLITESAADAISDKLSMLSQSLAGQSWIIQLSDLTAAPPYLWNDLQDDAKAPTLWNRYRGSFLLSQADVASFLERFSLDVLFRGHQQEDRTVKDGERPFSEGKWVGLYSRWRDRVITLNVAPNTGVFDACEEYFTKIGSWARLKKNDFKCTSDLLMKNTHGFPLEVAPDFLLQGLYFDPKTHKSVSYEKLVFDTV